MKIIDEEMDAVVKELKVSVTDVAELSVLDAVTEELQEKVWVRDTARA